MMKQLEEEKKFMSRYKLLKSFVKMCASYGLMFQPAENAKEAVQFVYLDILQQLKIKMGSYVIRKNFNFS